MTHRYNTRFQAQQQKQQQSNPREELLACTVLFPMKDVMDSTRQFSGMNLISVSYNTEEQQEIDNIKNMLNKVSEEPNQIKKALRALNIYHFLEWNQKIMQKNKRFRDVVRSKAQEFIAVSKERTDMLNYISSTSNEYSTARDLAIVTEELRESCERVISIINNIEK